MGKKAKVIFAAFIVIVALTACGEDPALTRFRKSMDEFCTKISEIDTSINGIDAQSDSAATELLGYLDDLDTAFQTFADLDFPDEFDYLEDLAKESSEYMTEAVKSYHDAYGNGSYNEYTAEYARQNYSRAYKRVQIIISFLHGEEPTDTDLTIEYENE
ncbi:MAG: hypothetical protein HFH89_07940 [Lachnospiraceae bacterium]|nr:hypothetical protein [uncultured Acetatifactor sp.]MCI8287566.1 hypothetical protein [Lachnospiraceae bacterium]